MSGAPSDSELRRRVIEDPADGWRLFIETYTPTLLAIIESAGVRRHDEAMDVYLRVCEHFTADDCARLRRHDPSKGALAAWLTVVVRHAVVDWVRSRKGRRRLFRSIGSLSALDQKVFELYYWQGHSAAEIVGVLSSSRKPEPTLIDVFDALERIEKALTERQRAELLALAARARDPVSLEDSHGQPAMDLADARGNPEERLHAAEAHAALRAALAELPSEDALIVSMRFLDGLSHTQIARALRIERLGAERIKSILDRLRTRIEQRGIDARDAAIAVEDEEPTP